MNTNFKKYFYQLLAACGAALGSFGCGCTVAWTAPMLPRITEGCGIHCDMTIVPESQAKWIGPMLPLGAMLAGPVVGVLVSYIGRIKTMLFLCLPFLLGFILLFLAPVVDHVALLYAGRILTGFGGGAFALVGPLYATEISDKSIHGLTSGMSQMMSTMGIAFVSGLNINDSVDWITITYICTGLPVVISLWLALLPESPYYLVKNGKLNEASKSLSWLCGDKELCIQSKLAELEKEVDLSAKVGSITLKELLTKKQYLKPFCMCILLMFYQKFCGINAILFSTQNIMMESGTSIDKGLASFLISGVAQILGTGLAIMISDRFGRKLLLGLSEVFMTLTLTGVGLYFYLKENFDCNSSMIELSNSSNIISNSSSGGMMMQNGTGPSVTEMCQQQIIENLALMPLICLVVYIFFFALGLGPLPWVLNVELNPPEAKSLSSSIAYCFNWLFAFLVTAMPISYEYYFAYASVCLTGVIFTVFFLPETKGKTAEQMRTYFLQ